MKDFRASLVCTHYRSRPNYFNRTGFSSVTVSNQTYFSVVYAFDYNNRNDLQSLQMMQEMTELSGTSELQIGEGSLFTRI
jgi:hypothetical protein